MNYDLFHLVNGWAAHHDAIDDVMEWTATWLIYVVFAATAAVCGWALWRRRLASLVRVVAALAVAYLAAFVVAHLSTERRPFQDHPVHQLIPHAAGVSMPSDHATAAFTMALAVGAFLSRRWGMALAVPAIAIGFARIWVGVHYPADIAVALLIAVAAVALVSGLARLIGRTRSKGARQPALDVNRDQVI